MSHKLCIIIPRVTTEEERAIVHKLELGLTTTVNSYANSRMFTVWSLSTHLTIEELEKELKDVPDAHVGTEAFCSGFYLGVKRGIELGKEIKK